MTQQNSALNKSLGLFQLTVYGVGTIIGAGIYSVIATATQAAGNGVWLSFILAAIAALFSALSYAELASAFPNAGAEYNFLNQAFPKFRAAGFLVGIFIAIHSAATLATVALTFALYFQSISNISPKIVALLLVSALTGVNILGLKRASWINVTMTTLQILVLLILCIIAMFSGKFLDSVGTTVTAPFEISKVLGSTAIIFFIYTGYEHLASLSEEVKDPHKNIWKAFIASLIITTLIYLAVIFSVLHLLGVEALSNSNQPLADAGRKVSINLGWAIIIAALMATANAVLSGSISVSRLLFGMARDGDLPSAFSKINKSKTPWFGALIALSIAATFILVGEIKLVASLSSLGALLVFAAINLATIVLRITKPNHKRPFHVPVAIKRVPILPACGILVSGLLATQYEFKVYIIFASGVALGYGIYIFKNKKVAK